jgi:hypothetical protein
MKVLKTLRLELCGDCYRSNNNLSICPQGLREHVDAISDEIVVEFTDRPTKESLRLTKGKDPCENIEIVLVEGRDDWLDRRLDDMIRDLMDKHGKRAIHATVYNVYDE